MTNVMKIALLVFLALLLMQAQSHSPKSFLRYLNDPDPTGTVMPFLDRELDALMERADARAAAHGGYMGSPHWF